MPAGHPTLRHRPARGRRRSAVCSLARQVPAKQQEGWGGVARVAAFFWGLGVARWCHQIEDTVLRPILGRLAVRGRHRQTARRVGVWRERP